MKKISVITVSLNSVKTIERTIKSVITQDYPKTEYIIIDGGSADGTIDIVKNYKDQLFYWVSEPDNGIYDAMNKAIDVATGDYILFLNSDDYFVDDNVLTRISTYLSGEEIIIGRVHYKDMLSDLVEYDKIKSKYYDIFYPHQATFIPRKLYESIGKFDESYKISADFDWICRATYRNIPIKWINEPVSYFSLGGLSSSLQCIIDEYNISKKYMELSKDVMLSDMTQKTIEKGRSYFFRLMLFDDKYLDKFKEFMDNVGVGSGSTVQIWGCGFWAKLFVEILNKCEISLDHIIDSNSNSHDLCGIPIVRYDRKKVSRIFISTETYDNEISELLRKDSFKEGINYFTFHSFRDEMLKEYDREDFRYVDFVEQTGLKIL